MFQFSQISESTYDEAARNITYAKLIPLLVKDFVTRIDSAQMMKPNNLPATTNVSTVVNTAVQVVVATGTGTGIGKGTGAGQGTVAPIIDSSVPHPQTQQLEAYWKAVEDAGGYATQAVLDTALGQ